MTALMALPFAPPSGLTGENPADRGGPPRQVFLMVPDGMGLSNITAARIHAGGPNGPGLALETLPYVGYQRTHSADNTVTDSAAAASAWAAGEKFANGEVSCHDQDRDGVCDGSRKNPLTILEIAKSRGMATGLVATSDITHATPAAFGAHVANRGCETEIFRQYMDLGIEVLLGGGIGADRAGCRPSGKDSADAQALVNRACSQGYFCAGDAARLAARPPGTRRLLGLFRPGGLTPVYLRGAACPEPSLAAMTATALDALKENPRGFFLLVEGSQIDWANHSRNPAYQIRETLAFDEAVGTVLAWIGENAVRRANTLVIVAPDHETGGVILTGPQGRLARPGDTEAVIRKTDGTPLTDQDGKPVHIPDVAMVFASNPGEKADHTAVDTLVWSNRPEYGGVMDNTDLFYRMRDFLEGGPGD